MEENKPTWVKWKLIKKVVISSSMWPGVVVEYVGK
jgi:ribosomal protein L1